MDEVNYQSHIKNIPKKELHEVSNQSRKDEAKNDPGKLENRPLLDNSEAESQKENMVETTLVQPINTRSNYPFFSPVSSKSSWFQDLKGFLFFTSGGARKVAALT